MNAAPVVLQIDQAEALLAQLQETATYRRWLRVAVGIMHTHLHAVVGVPGDPDPDKVFGDLKAYGSCRLNRVAASGEPVRVGPRTRWTTGGSKRKLQGERSIEAAVKYIREQPNPLVIWTREMGVLFSARKTDSSGG